MTDFHHFRKAGRTICGTRSKNGMTCCAIALVSPVSKRRLIDPGDLSNPPSIYLVEICRQSLKHFLTRGHTFTPERPAAPRHVLQLTLFPKTGQTHDLPETLILHDKEPSYDGALEVPLLANLGPQELEGTQLVATKH